MTGSIIIVLENNPDTLSRLCENLQVGWDCELHDLISTSPAFLRDCYLRRYNALIVLAEGQIFRAARSAIEPTIPVYKGSGPGEPVIWIKQTIGHACGLMALLCTPSTRFDSSPLSKRSCCMTRGFLEEAHMDAASHGSSNVPSPRDDNNHHFSVFVQTDRKVWELNEGLNGPLFRGVLGEEEDLLSERGLELTVRDFLIAAKQTGRNEMSIVAVTEAETVAQSGS